MGWVLWLIAINYFILLFSLSLHLVCWFLTFCCNIHPYPLFFEKTSDVIVSRLLLSIWELPSPSTPTTRKQSWRPGQWCNHIRSAIQLVKLTGRCPGQRWVTQSLSLIVDCESSAHSYNMFRIWFNFSRNIYCLRFCLGYIIQNVKKRRSYWANAFAVQ